MLLHASILGAADCHIKLHRLKSAAWKKSRLVRPFLFCRVLARIQGSGMDVWFQA